MSSMNTRVVVTGFGILCPLGLNVTTSWEGLVAGKSGIDYITLFDPKLHETKFAGEVKGFEPTDYISRKDAHRMDRFAQLAVAASLQAEIEGVDLVLDNSEKLHLLPLLEESGRLSSPLHGQRSSTTTHAGFRTRAFIKVHDGCNSFCSYCIVPLVRGGEKSTPVDQVVADVKGRVAEDYKEVVLTGTKLGSYNYEGVSLSGLLQHILTQTGVARLRLSSLQPQEISPELIRLWLDNRLCRHFHLSLQSGSDGVLSRMKRRYTAGDYQQAVALIRDMVPQAAITTDIIVGFPGETEAEFGQSYQLCRQMEFARIHVFSYSPRQGTQAALMPNQVEAQIKKQRSQRMLTLAKESAQNFRQQFLGKTMPVLWEKRSGDGVWSGLTDNYIRVYIKSDGDLTNKLLPVKLVELFNRDGVWGR